MNFPPVISLSSADRRFIIFGDIHRGDGTGADDFAKNSLTFKIALGYYRRKGFTCVELGDAEELWENAGFDQIYITHTSIYDELRAFHDPDPAKTRYIKLWGNHDLDWQDRPAPLGRIFPGIRVYEAALLDGHLLLLHGHQADPSCRSWGARISRFFVRHCWTRLQRVGFLDPTRAANNPGLSNRIDETLFGWATTGGGAIAEALGIENGAVDTIIAGHTHRPVFENLSLTERRLLEQDIGTEEIREKLRPDRAYYNVGSCVHPRAITGLEIVREGTDLRVSLIRWGYEARMEARNPEEESSGGQAGDDSFPLAIRRSVLEEGILPGKQE
ncbi:MAG: hypothetical protein U1C55_02565 [Smithellaceae bacterium]|nr:hypothetical protein [Smithellaceae bacterium]